MKRNLSIYNFIESWVLATLSSILFCISSNNHDVVIAMYLSKAIALTKRYLPFDSLEDSFFLTIACFSLFVALSNPKWKAGDLDNCYKKFRNFMVITRFNGIVHLAFIFSGISTGVGVFQVIKEGQLSLNIFLFLGVLFLPSSFSMYMMAREAYSMKRFMNYNNWKAYMFRFMFIFLGLFSMSQMFTLFKIKG